jgi:hypothetical protein
MSATRRDFGAWRGGFWGVIGFNATPEIKPKKMSGELNPERSHNPGVTAQ